MLSTTYEDTPVIRTDYSNPARWDEMCRVATTPNEEECAAYVEFLEDRAYRDLTLEQVLDLIPEGFRHRMLIVADGITMNSAEFPLLCIDLETDTFGRVLRVIAAELHSIENNISIVNMFFGEFIDAADNDGVFRGF
ncbi:DUF6924 domain-containing protein [Nocardia bovistercoris]|uniref:DUF6924 domain-containing protein n=1 Tax=Nocardia bovistercoris TaxID=2785916 RepID=A0A931I9X4_9NOCA|nr:hypothetical protein [Nocardia bovistercoris]MBH0776013.1 hypothetical protein [Nocardia bovistercoris]